MNIILLTYLSILKYQMSVIRRACLATKKNYLTLKCFDLSRCYTVKNQLLRLRNFIALLSFAFAVKLKFFSRHEKLRPRRSRQMYTLSCWLMRSFFSASVIRSSSVRSIPPAPISRNCRSRPVNNPHFFLKTSLCIQQLLADKQGNLSGTSFTGRMPFLSPNQQYQSTNCNS